MPGTLQVRSYRQRKAGARGGYSHRDLYGGADDWAAASAQPGGTALLFFPVWPLPCFVRLRHRPERNDRND